jgi:hypothetical protein
MSPSSNNYAFCTLALGSKYRAFTQDLANDLKKYVPQASLVVGTERPEEFAHYSNVIPFKHSKKGVLHCYHDKRFVIGKAITQFNTAIQIDADTRFTCSLPDKLDWCPGITAGHTANMVEHILKYSPERFRAVQEIAAKLNIKLDTTTWVGESLFVVTRDNGKEKAFLEYWDKISRYLELRGIHSGEGIAIGLSAAKAGLQILKSSSYIALNNARQHLDATDQVENKVRERKLWAGLKRRTSYHYRLNLSRISALQNYNFYYTQPELQLTQKIK